MTQLPSWMILQIEEERRLREQEDQREQLRLPLYDEPHPAEKQPDKPRTIIIEL